MGNVPKKEVCWKKFELDFNQNVKFEEVKLHLERKKGRRLKIDEVFNEMLELAYGKTMEEKMQEYKKTGS